MTVVAISSGKPLPNADVRVVARWNRPDNSGISIGHWETNSNEPKFYSWEVDTRGAVVPNSTKDHWTEKEALERITNAIDL